MTPARDNPGRGFFCSFRFRLGRRGTKTTKDDKNQHHIKTVKEKDLDRKRNLKHAADNMIYVTPGSHQVTIRRNGRILYDERIRLSADETKLIYL